MSAGLRYQRARLCRRRGLAVPRCLPRIGVAGSQGWIGIVPNFEHLLRIPPRDYARERTDFPVAPPIGGAGFGRATH